MVRHWLDASIYKKMTDLSLTDEHGTELYIEQRYTSLCLKKKEDGTTLYKVSIEYSQDKLSVRITDYTKKTPVETTHVLTNEWSQVDFEDEKMKEWRNYFG